MYVVNQNIQAKYICISSTEKQWTKLSRRVQYDYSRSRVTVDLTVDAPREQQQLGHSVKCLSPRYLELTDSPVTRLFVSHDTWSWLTLQGRGLSRASILRVDWLYLGSPGTRLFKSHDTWRKLTTVSLLGRDKTRRNQQLIARQNTELFDFRK